MDHVTRRHDWLLLLPLMASLWAVSGAQGSNYTPNGCGPSVPSLYYNLCDLAAVWGVVVEAFAAAGVVASLLLLFVLLASLPFAKDPKRRSSVGLQAGFLVGTLGLFGLAFAFVVGRNFATCMVRRFLFGVLFAACFACLLMQGVRLSMLAWRGGARRPRGWVLCLGALVLWLVEAIINTEWLVITVARSPVSGDPSNPVPCHVANQDFVMALIYVMVLLLASVASAVPALAGKKPEWRKEASFIVLTGLLSVGIWLAWIIMYVYGNQRVDNIAWDDPTLAIALVSNAWVFLILHAVPEVCMLTEDSELEHSYGEELYPARGVGYETILKEQSSHNMFMENKAFSMDEPATAPPSTLGHNKPVSPYSGYNGQLRSSVYQPTELAFITKCAGNMDLPYDTVLPRATATSPIPCSSVPSCTPEEIAQGPSVGGDDPQPHPPPPPAIALAEAPLPSPAQTYPSRSEPSGFSLAFADGAIFFLNIPFSPVMTPPASCLSQLPCPQLFFFVLTTTNKSVILYFTNSDMLMATMKPIAF